MSLLIVQTLASLSHSRGRRSLQMCPRRWKQPCWILPRLILLPGSPRTISDGVQMLIVCICRVSPQKMKSDFDTMCLSAPSFPSFLHHCSQSCCRSVVPPPPRTTSLPPGLGSRTCCTSVCDRASVVHLIAASFTIWWDEALSWGGKRARRKEKKKKGILQTGSTSRQEALLSCY